MRSLLQVVGVIYIVLDVLPPSACKLRRQAIHTCVTPDNFHGQCVAFNRCPQVLRALQGGSSQRDWAALKTLQKLCGYTHNDGEPAICCANPSWQPAGQWRGQPTTSASNPFLPVTRSPMQSTDATSTMRRNPFLPPLTDPFVPATTSQAGTVPMTTPPYTHMPTPMPATTPTYTSNPFTLPTMKPTSVIDVPPMTVRTLQPVATESTATTACDDVHFGRGNCLEIKSCQRILHLLLSQKNNKTLANYLRDSNRICGGRGAQICCPTDGNDRDDASSRPDILVPKTLPTIQDGCGFAKQNFKKIVGGKQSRVGSWPWMALLGYEDVSAASPFRCGGALITARHVLTAAHCILRQLQFVRLGEHDLSTDTETHHVDIKVEKAVKHPDYSVRDGHSDVAVVYLAENVQFSDLILPICMPAMMNLRHKSYLDENAFVAGWGKTAEGGNSSTVLNELMIKIYANSICKTSYSNHNLLKSARQFDAGIICAGALEGGEDTCQGDSGGPLMAVEIHNNRIYYISIGIISYGIGCARAGVPGVYASTQHFIDWIEAKIAETP